MKNVLLVIFTILIFAGCYSAEKKAEYKDHRADLFTVSGICPTREYEDQWRAQSVDEMRKSGNIPSVDFEFDSFVLVPSSYETLDKVAEILTSNTKLKLIIDGHTDEVGSFEYNDWLSNARTNSVKSYLVSRGVHPDSIKIFGHGKRMPLINHDSPEARACNRRITFRITKRPWGMVF